MSSWHLPELLKERDIIKREFPTVTPLNDPPTIYEGMLRCEKGPVKELADKGIWPFTEYVKWHRFRLELPKEFPYEKPIVTWLTDISHPNIVPNIRGAVCISILGKAWSPNTTIVSVINSLYFLLTDPNPWDVYKHPTCLKSGEALREHGFPKTKKMEEKQKEGIQYHDVVRFTVMPTIPQEIPTKPKISEPSDIVRFTFPKRKKKKVAPKRKGKVAQKRKGKKVQPSEVLYFCSKCGRKHFYNSRIGSEHSQYVQYSLRTPQVNKERKTKAAK